MTKSYIILLPTVMAQWKAAACVAGGGCSVIWEYHLRLSAETATYWTQHNHQVNIWQQLELPLSRPHTAESNKTGSNVSLTQGSGAGEGRGLIFMADVIILHMHTHHRFWSRLHYCELLRSAYQSSIVHPMANRGRQTPSFQVNDLQNNVQLSQLVQLPMLAGMWEACDLY